MKSATLDRISEVRAFAENPLSETRVVDTMTAGQWARQGDVYIEMVGNPADWKTTTNRQLAIGSTIGSRHTVDESVTVLSNPQNGVVQPDGKGGAICLGPQIVSKDRFTVSHPEHADISLPAGCFQVRFQVDPQSLQRVQD